MRRNDFDVTDRIRTTDAAAVQAEVERVHAELYGGATPSIMQRAFSDAVAQYRGDDPDYLPCDTEYHDVQHILDVTLAMARIMDGYERARVNGAPRLDSTLFELGVLIALFHDQGYLRHRQDRRHRYGSEYTLTHVSRSVAFARRYMRKLGIPNADTVAPLIHFTGYERPAASIRTPDPLLRRLGYMLGTADIVAQMADRCYLEKCRDRLYPEFVLGGIARKRLSGGGVVVMFESGDDLVRKTPGFYHNAMKRLDQQLEHVYDYAEHHFSGQNLYIEEMEKNIRYAERVAQDAGADLLRRAPPNTLPPDVEPYPPDLVIR